MAVLERAKSCDGEIALRLSFLSGDGEGGVLPVILPVGDGRDGERAGPRQMLRLVGDDFVCRQHGGVFCFFFLHLISPFGGRTMRSRGEGSSWRRKGREEAVTVLCGKAASGGGATEKKQKRGRLLPSPNHRNMTLCSGRYSCNFTSSGCRRCASGMAARFSSSRGRRGCVR